MSLLFFAAWLVLLVHCLSCRRFAPVFATHRRTKLFWLATFVFFDPWLLLLYAVFGAALPPTWPRRRWRTAGVVGLVLLILTVGWVPFAPGTSPRVLERKEGEMVETVGGMSLWPEVSFRVFLSGASSQSMTSESGGIPDVLICRRIALLVRSSHPLARRLALELQDRLSRLEFVESVAYWPAGSEPPEGGGFPDLALAVELNEVSGFRLPFFSRFSGSVGLRSYYTPPREVTTTPSDFRPVGHHWSWERHLDIDATLYGYESAAARFSGLAGTVAAGVELPDHLEEMAMEHGVLTDVPTPMEGDFRPSGPPGIFQTFSGWRRVLSGSAPLQHHVSVWEFEVFGETQNVFDAIQEGLETGGWSHRRNATFHGEGLYLEQGQRRLHVLRPRRPSSLRVDLAFDPEEGAFEQVEKPPAEVSPGRYVVHYAEGFSAREFRAVIDEMLESSVSPLVLAGFEPVVPRSRLEELQDLLRRASGSSPRVHLALSRIAERLDDSAAARDELLRAVILAKVFSIEMESDLENRAEELGLEEVPEFPADPRVYRELGFIEIRPAPTRIERELGLGEPLVVFYERGAGPESGASRFRFVYVRVTGEAGDSESRVFEHAEFTPGGGASRSRGSFSAGEHAGHTAALRLENGSCTLSVERLANDRFRVEIDVRVDDG